MARGSQRGRKKRITKSKVLVVYLLHVNYVRIGNSFVQHFIQSSWDGGCLLSNSCRDKTCTSIRSGVRIAKINRQYVVSLFTYLLEREA